MPGLPRSMKEKNSATGQCTSHNITYRIPVSAPDVYFFLNALPTSGERVDYRMWNVGWQSGCFFSRSGADRAAKLPDWEIAKCWVLEIDEKEWIQGRAADRNCAASIGGRTTGGTFRSFWMSDGRVIDEQERLARPGAKVKSQEISRNLGNLNSVLVDALSTDTDAMQSMESILSEIEAKLAAVDAEILVKQDEQRRELAELNAPVGNIEEDIGEAQLPHFRRSLKYVNSALAGLTKHRKENTVIIPSSVFRRVV
ncbi:hypothetical protein C8J57DRAFT_1242597 [Mycena rebaudengoi]|nr:hypothetical protein C8J57DRAFT_1242597 [Mycena rebaudengoi]